MMVKIVTDDDPTRLWYICHRPTGEDKFIFVSIVAMSGNVVKLALQHVISGCRPEDCIFPSMFAQSGYSG